MERFVLWSCKDIKIRDLDKQDVETIQSSFLASTNNSVILLMKYMALIHIQLLAESNSNLKPSGAFEF